MSIYNDTQELQKIFEDVPIFKAASEEQVARRHLPEDMVGGLIDEIKAEMASDDSNESVRLYQLYKNSNNADRMILDKALVCLCGWSLHTMILRVTGQEI